eukprot:9183008-Lingulodinium_polyedra.AAC.1
MRMRTAARELLNECLRRTGKHAFATASGSHFLKVARFSFNGLRSSRSICSFARTAAALCEAMRALM